LFNAPVEVSGHAGKTGGRASLTETEFASGDGARGGRGGIALASELRLTTRFQLLKNAVAIKTGKSANQSLSVFQLFYCGTLVEV
jgi:hypothetical protein